MRHLKKSLHLENVVLYLEMSEGHSDQLTSLKTSIPDSSNGRTADLPANQSTIIEMLCVNVRKLGERPAS